jgi:secreted Zn-dependent insulinase-like peptidase
LNININLTEDGLANYRQVVELSFQQIELVRSQGVQAWRYNEEQQLSELGFRFKEPSQPMYEVLGLAGKLRRYPTRELLHGDYLFAQFDAPLIDAYLNYLRPDNLLLTLSSPEQATDRVEPHYQAEYSLQPLERQWLSRLQQLPANDKLAIPAPNPFIPQRLELLTLQPMLKPQLLVEQPGLRLWYQQDQQFRVPKSDLFFSFRSPLANDTPRHQVMTHLLIKLLNEQLNAFLYPAYEAGFNVDIYPHVRGFSTRISGYSDRQQQLLEKVTTNIKQFPIEPDKLALFKQELRRQLLNKAKEKPYNQAFDALYQRILSPRWSTEQQLAEIDAIEVDPLRQFRERLLQRGNIEALVHGNTDFDQARELGQLLHRQLLSKVEPVEVAAAYARQLAQGTESQELAVDHNDSALVVYLQGEQKSTPLRARYGLLASILKAPFYTELRTEKQRGYVVFASAMPIQQHPALALVIQSPSSSPDTLLSDVEHFLERGLQLVKALDQQQLDSFKQGLINELMKQEQKLSQRSNRYWQEIDKGYSNFDSREQLAKAIREVSQAELVQTYQQLQQRRLVIRSTGNAHQS